MRSLAGKEWSNNTGDCFDFPSVKPNEWCSRTSFECALVCVTQISCSAGAGEWEYVGRSSPVWRYSTGSWKVPSISPDRCWWILPAIIFSLNSRYGSIPSEHFLYRGLLLYPWSARGGHLPRIRFEEILYYSSPVSFMQSLSVQLNEEWIGFCSISIEM